MSIEDRLWDDSVFQPVSAPEPVPHFVASLLIRKGIQSTDPKLEAQVVAEWLKDHEPSDWLRQDIIERGHGHLLDSAATA